MRPLLALTALFLTADLLPAAPPLTLPTENARRLEILFLGAPTANAPAHDPIERYRVMRKHLGVAGINLTYTENLADLRRDYLDRFDAVLLYGNWPRITPEQESALNRYIEDGHGFLPIHCASACFEHSLDFSKLVGGHFKSHGTGVFRTTIVAPEHPIMKGYDGFETWDETYVHDRLTNDRTLLQKREEEPWTWVRTQGKGRVFYTAYGHDMRCWGQPQFHELLRRAILWSVNDATRAKYYALKLPKLETEKMELPGYRERKLITEGQKPLPPEQSIKLAQVPNGFEISLFASEPDIVNPIFVNWDERGRAFVIQTVDYPNNLQANNIGHDSIKICEDTNGDGRADKFTLFADKLSIPTSLVFANGGVICTNGSDMLFLQDTNGDDKADVRKVLFTGFNMGDTHAGVSNLRYGFDGWIYATIGYSGFNGEVGGESKRFSTGVFRFKPDGSKLEFIQGTTNNTWGLGFTSNFDILGSTANGNPSFSVSFPREAYQKAGVEQPKTPRADDNPMFFPSSLDIRQVDQFDRYTAGAGHSFTTSTRMPAEYRDRIAYICEPTGKLVGSFDVTLDGANYTSKQLPNNLYSSADAWSGPVCAEEGPDGAIWVCDWYNLIIQHNPTPSVASAGLAAQTGKGNAYETPVRDTKHGRIYRIYPKGSKNEVAPKLDPRNPESLVTALKHPNLLWRLHAQRLLVENKLTAAAPALKQAVSAAQPGSIQAFNALDELGALDEATIRTALQSNSRGLRRAAIEAASSAPYLTQALIQEGTIRGADLRELAENLVALAEVPTTPELGKALFKTLQSRAAEIAKDSTLRDAWLISAHRHAASLLIAAASEVKVENSQSSEPVNLIKNPGFDGKAGEAAPGWSLRVYGGKPEDVEMALSDGGRNGGTCLMIRAKQAVDAGAGIELNLKPKTRYRFAAWIKTENLNRTRGLGALLNAHGKEPKSQDVSGTKDWTRAEFDFDSDNGPVLLHCLFGGYGGATGTAWFDDVSLTELGESRPTDLIPSIASYLASKGTAEQKQQVIAAFSQRQDAFAKGIITTLGAAPVTPTEIVRKNKIDPEVHKRGSDVYGRTCIACHGPDGKGVPGAFPPLDGSEWPVGNVSVPIRILLHGLQGPIEVKGQKFQNIMPPHVDLKDEEIADVLTYVRQNWSNDASPVDAATVKKIRAEYHERKAPWTAAELSSH